MTIVAGEAQTKAGRHVMRCTVSGHVTKEEALDLLEQTKVLMKRVGTKPDLLCNVAAGTDYSPESRRIFTKEFTPYSTRTAVIVTSKLVRAAINFMTRMAAGNTELRVFDDEASAIVWLDE